MLKQERGITLVALVITVVILLILAAVTLSMVIGPEGIISKTNEAKTATITSEVQDNCNQAITTALIDYYTEETGESAESQATYIYDDLVGNLADTTIQNALPSGYTISNVSISEAVVTATITVSETDYTMTYDASTGEVSVQLAN